MIGALLHDCNKKSCVAINRQARKYESCTVHPVITKREKFGNCVSTIKFSRRTYAFVLFVSSFLVPHVIKGNVLYI
jgi:hypothetical protein